MMQKLKIIPGSSIRSQILEFYRTAIRSGKLPEGSVLPPARKLAAELGTAEANVHHAIARLAKEGLIVRRPKIGSVVSGPARMYRVAFFLPELYTRRGERFTRPLIEILERELAEQGIREFQVIYETASKEGWKLLEQLAESHRIQGVLVRGIHEDERALFSRLPIPFAAITDCSQPAGVRIVTPKLAESMLEGVKLQGCRSSGVIFSGSRKRCKSLFAAASDRAGVEIRPEWMFCRDDYGSDILDIDHFGYLGSERILAAPTRPEALMLFSDDLVAGVTMRLYAARLRVPETLKLVIHRTVENPVVFPFECVLVEQSISELARLLVGKLIDEFEGRKPRKGELSIRTVRNSASSSGFAVETH